MKKLFEIIKKSGLLFYLLFVFINYFVDDIFLKNTDIPMDILVRQSRLSSID